MRCAPTACTGSIRRRLVRLAGLLWLLLIAPAAAEPMVPTDDGFVLDYLPEAQDPGHQALHEMHAQLRARRDDLKLAVQIARAEINECRKLFDPRACGRADAALGPWINASNPPVEVLLLRGLLRQTAHLFDAALADLAQVLAVQPLNAQALLTRAVIHQVRAEYALARTDCATAAFRVGQAAQVACLAGTTSLTGHAAVSLAALRQADTDAGSSDAERLWALTVEAEVAARLGKVSEAEDAFRRARAITPDDSYLLGAYADLLLDLGRFHEVVAMLADHTRIDPLLLRLTEAEDRLGMPVSGHIDALGQSFETSRRRGDIVHQREQARFELHVLHRTAEALVTAQANWQVQREPSDARILMETALAAHQPRSAQPAVEWFHANHTEDVTLASLVHRLEVAS